MTVGYGGNKKDVAAGELDHARSKHEFDRTAVCFLPLLCLARWPTMMICDTSTTSALLFLFLELALCEACRRAFVLSDPENCRSRRYLVGPRLPLKTPQVHSLDPQCLIMRLCSPYCWQEKRGWSRLSVKGGLEECFRTRYLCVASTRGVQPAIGVVPSSSELPC